MNFSQFCLQIKLVKISNAVNNADIHIICTKYNNVKLQEHKINIKFHYNIKIFYVCDYFVFVFLKNIAPCNENKIIKFDEIYNSF